MILIRHTLSEDELEAEKKRLSEKFRSHCIDFSELLRNGSVVFERVGASATELCVKLSVFNAALKAQMEPNFTALKKTAWERRNPNAPWYRQFNHRRRE